MSDRILFVDDDLRILDGLQRSLPSQSPDWELLFAKNGLEALDLDTQLRRLKLKGLSACAMNETRG